MLYHIMQMGLPSDKMGVVFLTLGLLITDLILLKISLMITRATRWKTMKWAAASYGIQFGAVFAVGSPLFLLGMIGAFRGDPGPIILVVIISAFLDMNVVNVIHHLGLKRSLIVVLIIIIPMIFVMYNLGELISIFT